MKTEIIEILSLGTSNINHITEDGTKVIDLKSKGEEKWNELLTYLNEYCNQKDMTIKDIDNGKIWLISN